MFRETVTHAPRFSEDVSNNWMHLTWTMMAPIETITVQQKRKKISTNTRCFNAPTWACTDCLGFFFFCIHGFTSVRFTASYNVSDWCKIKCLVQVASQHSGCLLYQERVFWWWKRELLKMAGRSHRPTDEISYLTKDQRVQTSNAEMNSQNSPPPYFGLAGWIRGRY